MSAKTKATAAGKRKRDPSLMDELDDAHLHPPLTHRKKGSVYTSAQKSAIQQYVALTQSDKSSAAKILKQNGWDVQSAANTYFSGGANTSNPHKEALVKLFDSYREDPQNEPDEVNMEGMMKMMGEMDISLEGVGLLIFSELVQSPTLGKLTRDGFVSGLSRANVNDLSKTRDVILQREANLPQKSFRTSFKSIYKHTFIIARQQGQKAVQLEAAIEYWKVLFSEPSLAWSASSTPWLDWWIEFLQERWKKSVNKDMWDQTLSFADKTLEDESLKWWSEDSAWPGVIDEFVEYVQKDKRGGDTMDTS